jgi:hypothetical protein
MQQHPDRIALRRLSMLAGLGVIALLAGGVAFHSAARATGTPVVQITPDHGPWHTMVVVSGQNFGPNEQVAIYKGTRPFFAWNTDASGSFVGRAEPMIGPGPLSGIIPITATGRTSGLKAKTTFTITN